MSRTVPVQMLHPVDFKAWIVPGRCKLRSLFLDLTLPLGGIPTWLPPPPPVWVHQLFIKPFSGWPTS